MGIEVFSVKFVQFFYIFENFALSKILEGKRNQLTFSDAALNKL